MSKYTRNERVSLIMKRLTENPEKLLSLGDFAKEFDSSKSTISEDILILREMLEKTGSGKVETIAGAAGGVRFSVRTPKEKKEEFVNSLLKNLDDQSRIVPGNFLYVTDIMQNPSIISKAGAILSEKFSGYAPDYIITVETKGIPLAYEVARNMGVELVVARRNMKITEGTSVMINYLSGSQGMLSVMSLSKRSIRPGSRLIFIDDFLRGGGTVKGIMDLIHEFSSELIGIGVMVDSKETEKQLSVPLINFCDYSGIDNDGKILIKISNLI